MRTWSVEDGNIICIEGHREIYNVDPEIAAFIVAACNAEEFNASLLRMTPAEQEAVASAYDKPRRDWGVAIDADSPTAVDSP